MTGRPANSRIATGSNAMSNPFSLEGKVALVTGANTGLGQGIAVAQVLEVDGSELAAQVLPEVREALLDQLLVID